MCEKVEIFGDQLTSYHRNLVARRNFFIGKPWKTAFFSFRENTLEDRRKFKKFQLPKVPYVDLQNEVELL